MLSDTQLPKGFATMAKTKLPDRQQLGVRVSPESVELLELLQVHYGHRAGLTLPVSQSQAVEIMIRETAQRENLKQKKR